MAGMAKKHKRFPADSADRNADTADLGQRDAKGTEALAEKPKGGQIGVDQMPGYHDLFVENTITPAKIQNATSIYRIEGKLQGLGNLFDLFLDSDDNLQSDVDVRKAALKRVNWSFDGGVPKQKAEWYDKLLSRCMSGWIDEFIEGKLKGYQFQQIMWEQEEGLWLPSRLLSYKNLDLRIKSRELKLYDSRGVAMELPEYKFMRQIYKRPALLSVLRYYVFYAFAVNNWAQFVETYGKPPRIGKYEPGATAAEVNVLKSAVKALGTDQAAVISKNTEIEFKDFAGKDSSKMLYETMCQFVSDRVTRRILGQTLTTGEGDTGSYAQAKIHQMVREDIQDADLNDLRDYVSGLLNWCDVINHDGKGVGLWLELPKPVDLEKRIVIDTALVNLGLPIAQDHFYDTYGVDRPKSGQMVVERVNGERGTVNSEEVHTDLTDLTDKVERVERDERVESCAVSDKSLAKLQREIRGLGSIEELREYNPRWFIEEFGGALAAEAVTQYVKARQAMRSRKKSANALPEIKWEWDSESIILAGNLRRDAVITSGVRTKAALAALNTLASAAVDAGVSFQEFIQAANLAGFEPENPYHWRTEFETARVASAAAGKWAELSADADILPYLKYVTVGDELVREEHRALHGLTASVDDPVWDSIYPPNGWNCRCDVEQLTAGEGEKEPGLNQAPETRPEPGFERSVKDGRLPGGARAEYDRWAEGEQGTENSERGTVNSEKEKAEKAEKAEGKIVGMSWWQRIFRGAEAGVVNDRAGYPVDLGGNAEAAEVVKGANEVWQQLNSTSYIRLQGGKVRVATVSDGKVTELREWTELEYKGQGRVGFRELGGGR